MNKLPVELLPAIFCKEVRAARLLSRKYAAIKWDIELLVHPLWQITGNIKKLKIDYRCTWMIPHTKKMIVEITGGRGGEITVFDLNHLRGVTHLEIVCKAHYDHDIEADVSGLTSLRSLLIRGRIFVGTENLTLDEFGIVQINMMVPNVVHEAGNSRIYDELGNNKEELLSRYTIPPCKILALDDVFESVPDVEHIYLGDYGEHDFNLQTKNIYSKYFVTSDYEIMERFCVMDPSRIKYVPEEYLHKMIPYSDAPEFIKYASQYFFDENDIFIKNTKIDCALYEKWR